MALGETQVMAATKRDLAAAGVDVAALEAAAGAGSADKAAVPRSADTLLVKNLPYATTAADLEVNFVCPCARGSRCVCTVPAQNRLGTDDTMQCVAAPVHEARTEVGPRKASACHPRNNCAPPVQAMFGAMGELRRVVLPDTRTLALVEFLEAADARAAFRGLAYKRFQHVPLYLEWAPADIFTAKVRGAKAFCPAGQ